MAPKKSRRSVQRHRSTMSLQKTEIIIHVYDLLPPGKMSSVLWTMGTSLLHSGVVINGTEYAYGGHDRPGLTGVYFAKPKKEPPGGTFKCEILHGFTLATQEEIESIIRSVSEDFQGTSYNLLTKNCNHFTSSLCEKLTGRPGPTWLNRAASIGVALPCVVPRDWIEPPEYDTADGALLDDDEFAHERRSSEISRHLHLVGRESTDQSEWNSEDERRQGGSGKGKGKAPARDTDGRPLPRSERAPTS